MANQYDVRNAILAQGLNYPINTNQMNQAIANYSALNQSSPYVARTNQPMQEMANVRRVQPQGYSSLGGQMSAMGLPMPTGQARKRTTGAKTPPNWKDNLLNYVLSPKGQGMAQGLLEASGYSTTPISFGQALARGMQRGTEAETAAAASQLAKDKLAYQKEQDKILNSLKLQEILAGVASGSTDTAKIKDFKFYKDLSKDDKDLFDKLIRTSPENALAMALASTAGSQGQATGITLSPLDVAYDKAFATKAVEWETLGFAETESNLDKLQTNIEKLKTQDNLTGFFIGLMPDKIKAAINPEALALKNDIESIIFQSLKATLGAQFTEREGRMLVAANFNEMLPEEVNLKRMQRLYDTTMKASKAKEDKIAYFRKNGTIKGWEGQVFTFEDIASSLVDKKDYKNLSQKELEDLYVSTDLNDYEAQVIEELLKDMAE
jgi:hypothetical protein